MPTNLYGPGDSFDLNDSHVLPAMLRKFHIGKLLSKNRPCEDNQSALDREYRTMSGEFGCIADCFVQHGITAEFITLWGTGRPRREFLYVDDLADACLLLMERHNAGEIGETINIGSGTDISLGDLATMIQKIVGFTGNVKWDTTKPDGMPRKLLEISRIRELGWSPKISLEEGIDLTYQWYMQH